MPSSRSLHVTVNFTGAQANDGSYFGSASYSHQNSSPPMNEVVSSNGDVNLHDLPVHPDYNWAIGMNFILNAVVTDRNGNNVPCTWANTLDKACTITGPDGATANGMTVSLPSPTHLIITNDNNDHHKAHIAERIYAYKLGVILPSLNNYFISLDPKITNTGVT